MKAYVVDSTGPQSTVEGSSPACIYVCGSIYALVELHRFPPPGRLHLYSLVSLELLSLYLHEGLL